MIEDKKMINESIKYQGIEYVISDIVQPDIKGSFEYKILTEQSFNLKFNFNKSLENISEADKDIIRKEYNEFLFNFLNSYIDINIFPNEGIGIGDIVFKSSALNDFDEEEQNLYDEIGEVLYGISILKFTEENFKFKWFCKVNVTMNLDSSNLTITEKQCEDISEKIGLIVFVKNNFSQFTEKFMKEHMVMYKKIKDNIESKIYRPIAFYVEKLKLMSEKLFKEGFLNKSKELLIEAEKLVIKENENNKIKFLKELVNSYEYNKAYDYAINNYKIYDKYQSKDGSQIVQFILDDNSTVDFVFDKNKIILIDIK
jgi:hypothetical protein